MGRTSVPRVYRKSGAIPLSNRATLRWSFEGGNAPVIGAPFSAIITVQSAMTYRDGNRVIRDSTVRRLYRDSHGRTRADDVFTAAGSTDNPVSSGITIYDSVARKQYHLHPESKTFNPLPWLGASEIHPPLTAPVPSIGMSVEIGYFRGASGSECKTVSLGEQVIDGIKAVGTRVEHTIPSGTFGNQKPIDIRVEQWFSPDLGAIIQTTRWSSIGTEEIHRLEHVVRAEPDASLFTVPPDYADARTAALAEKGSTSAATVSPTSHAARRCTPPLTRTP